MRKTGRTISFRKVGPFFFALVWISQNVGVALDDTPSSIVYIHSNQISAEEMAMVRWILMSGY